MDFAQITFLVEIPQTKFVWESIEVTAGVNVTEALHEVREVEDKNIAGECNITEK